MATFRYKKSRVFKVGPHVFKNHVLKFDESTAEGKAALDDFKKRLEHERMPRRTVSQIVEINEIAAKELEKPVSKRVSGAVSTKDVIAPKLVDQPGSQKSAMAGLEGKSDSSKKAD